MCFSTYAGGVIPYPNIGETLVTIPLPGGMGLPIRWYGLMYVVGFIIGYFILKRRAARGFLPLSYFDIGNFLSALMIGMLIGARLFYVIFYNFDKYTSSPLDFFKVWEGGLSFHGAAFGMTMTCVWFARSRGVSFLKVVDSFAIAAPLGLFFGRIGNFINGELYGRVTDVPWAMVFPKGGDLARHPSQLYQGLTEGIALFFVMNWVESWLLKKNQLRPGITGCTFLVGYGVFRFFTEFFRQPDSQFRFGGYDTQDQCYLALGQDAAPCLNEMGTVAGGLSMGQWLCVVMIVLGLGIGVHLWRTRNPFRPVPPSDDFLNFIPGKSSSSALAQSSDPSKSDSNKTKRK